MTFAVFALALAAAPPAVDFKPAETYAVIAGVLQWPGNKLSGFPTKNRKDEELYEVLRARGVPAENMRLLLDEQATYSGIKRAIRDVSASAPAGSTLVVYYCGHGFPCGAGDVCFANYDLMPRAAERTGLLVSDIGGMVKASFRGKRVLFLADCCFSGGLAKTAETLAKAGYEAASLTSSDETMVSTVNWTFTQTVIDGLTGDTFADANADGVVTLSELAGDVKAAMRAQERQRHGYVAHGFPGDFKLAESKRKPSAVGKFKAGEFVVVTAGAVAAAGRLTGEADGKYAVQFYDYTEKRTVQVPADKVAAVPADWKYKDSPVNLRPGEKAEIEVEWNGQWYPAVVLKKDGDRTSIRYVGFGDEWNEWVPKARIRPLPANK